MTEEEFTKEMLKLRHAFVGKFDVTKTNVTTWFSFLGRFDTDVFQYAVNEWIMRERTAPSIAELRKYAFEAKEKKVNHPEQWEWERNEQWGKMRL